MAHCAIIRKAACSIPSEVIEIFQLLKTSGSIMSLGCTQSLTEMSTKDIFWE